MTRIAMMKAMKASISNVLETMFFLMVQISGGHCTPQEWFPRSQPLMGATLNFNGPVTGTFYLLIPLNMAEQIAANFLGLNAEEINVEQRKDTVKEALNMIGGGILSNMEQNGAFKLGIPKMIEEDALSYETLNTLYGDGLFIETSEHRLAAGVKLDKPLA